MLAVFTAIGTALTGVAKVSEDGTGVFHKGDQVAMIGLGVFFAAGIMLIARPRVEADGRGIRIRNIIGGYDLPWQAVREVSFKHGQPWLTLELENDDAVSVLAVQAVDKQHALWAVREIRALHAAARGQSASGLPAQPAPSPVS